MFHDLKIEDNYLENLLYGIKKSERRLIAHFMSVNPKALRTSFALFDFNAK